MKKILIWAVGICFGFSVAHGTESYLSNFTVSSDINRQTLAPIGIGYRFPNTLNEIWASVRVNNPNNRNKIGIVWYQNGKKIKQNEIKGESDIRLHAASLNRHKKYLFPVAKFRVDFLLNSIKQGSISFEFVSSRASQSAKPTQCIEPTQADNKNLISDMLEQHPDMQHSLRELNLKRFNTAPKRFSLLSPSGWQTGNKLGQNDFLHLSRPSNLGETDYVVRQIPLDMNITGQYDSKSIIRGVAKMIVSLGIENYGKLANKVNVSILHDVALGSFMLSYKSSKKVLYELHTLIYDKHYLYDIVIITDKQGLEVSRFLAIIAAYSFWTKESCKR